MQVRWNLRSFSQSLLATFLYIHNSPAIDSTQVFWGAMTNESFNNADKKEDNYALDDTSAGRVVQAGFAGVALSLPDYIKNPKALITSYILLLGSFAGLVGYLNAIDEDEATTPEPPAESSLPLWQLIAGLSIIAVLKVLGLRKLAKALTKRGVKKPWSIFGGVGAGVVFAASEYGARRGQ